MKAVVYKEYGPPDVLRLAEVERPSPNDNEILIKVHATTVTAGDRRVRSLDVPFGFKLISRLVFGVLRPRKTILGSELAGEVETVGRGVTAFRPGDQVLAFDGFGMGCYAEYKCLAANAAIARKPENLGYEQAAALCFGGTTALDFFRRGELKRGEKLLINGASGAVGSAAVQLAKHFGAQVTAVCSGANVELVKSLGADRVIDYTQEDFATDGETYDVIMDTVGTANYARCKHVLSARGRMLLVLADLTDMLMIPWISATTKRTIIAGPAAERAQDVQLLVELAAAGKFKPVIDRRYALEQIVDAHRYVDAGHKKGNVVITLIPDADGDRGL